MFNNGFHHVVFIHQYDVVFDVFAKQLLKHWSILKKKQTSRFLT